MGYRRISYRLKALILSLSMAISFGAVASKNTQFNNLQFKSAQFNNPQYKNTLKIFSKDSLGEIKKLHAGKPFVLVVWSVDCLPCRQEFEMLREIKNQYPELNLSIVATESTQDVPQLVQVLTEHQLLTEDNWAFAETNSAKLRYALDPNWYGELPRAYFYNYQHTSIAVSGKLPKSKVIQWIEHSSSQD